MEINLNFYHESEHRELDSEFFVQIKKYLRFGGKCTFYYGDYFVEIYRDEYPGEPQYLLSITNHEKETEKPVYDQYNTIKAIKQFLNEYFSERQIHEE